MMDVMNAATSYYKQIINSGDPRTAHLPLVRDPAIVVWITLSYILAVMAGRKLMEHRTALELRRVLVVYNLASVVASGWMMYEFAVTTIFNPDFNLLCEDLDPSDNSPMTTRLITVQWCYFISKSVETADTFFFVLRKKNNQISFLHVYHHAAMIPLQWALIKYQPGSITWFGPFFNCFIHSIMYAYYCLAALGPHMQKYLWWKRYLTMMQLTQFFFVIVQLLNTFNTGCKYNTMCAYINFAFVITLVGLFTDFYIRSYRANKKRD